MPIYPIILAGGWGTRLWPLSRRDYPKQFLSLIGKKSLLQDTLARLDGLGDVCEPIVVCNENHRFLAVEQIGQIGAEISKIILEPVGRNTAPALTLAALYLNGAQNGVQDDPIMLVMPSDHIILDRGTFQAAVIVANPLADQGDIVTFGVIPNMPQTGYGYIRKGEIVGDVSDKQRYKEQGFSPNEAIEDQASSIPIPYRAVDFIEKPDLASAEDYVESGQYFWNSGIFVMRTSVWMKELQRNRPDIFEACQLAYSKGDSDGIFYRPSTPEFFDCPSDSIDYAVMEKLFINSLGHSDDTNLKPFCTTTGIDVVPLDAGWSDIGDLGSLWKERELDPDGNVADGDVYAEDTENSLLLAQDRLLATLGIKDMVVVETSDAILVAKKDRVGELSGLVDRLKSDGRPEYNIHRKSHRPWGNYEVIDEGEGFQVKRLTVNPGAALSLQMHRHRAEHWVVVRGVAKVTKNDEIFYLNENESTYVSRGTIHRLENSGDTELEIIEIQSGIYLAEDDIVRFNDDYDRHKTPKRSS